MQHFTYIPTGTCSRRIEFDIEDGKVHNVNFHGGCPGNTMGLASLIEGCPAEEVIRRLKGIPCRDKNTSCPDQLARAIRQAVSK